jgi:elongation factor Ts
MSTQITTELIKELRDSTGISVMQCKKALEEAEGDMEKALAILKKTSSDVALKKADRETKDGAVSAKAKAGKGVLLSLLCETDFVSKNEDFVKVLDTLLDKALDSGKDKVEEEAKGLIDGLIQKTGENISLGEILEVEGDTINYYIHGNKKAVLVSLEGGNEDLAKDIAMHVAAMRPEYISEEEIDEDTRERMIEIFKKEIAEVDKPEEIKAKMLEGKINTYFKEQTLMNQPFIKDGNETIASLLEKNSAKIKDVKFYYI